MVRRPAPRRRLAALAADARQSLRIVPAPAHAASFSHAAAHASSAPSAPGVHDTLRHGVGPSPLDGAGAPPASAHPLEARLRGWEATRDALRMQSLRRAFGVAEPVRRGMELSIVRAGEWRPLALGPGLASVHEDILRGHDDSMTWDDVFTGEATRGAVAFHDEMEKKLKIQ